MNCANSAQCTFFFYHFCYCCFVDWHTPSYLLLRALKTVLYKRKWCVKNSVI